MATKKKTTKTTKKKKKMTTERPPQAHEVLGHVAQDLLGFDDAASVRKLRQLGKIEGRKIGRDVWYDKRTIEAYLATRTGPGRKPVEEPRKKRLSADEQKRITWRRQQRDWRERQGGATKASGRGASKKSAKKPAAGKAAAKKAKGRK